MIIHKLIDELRFIPAMRSATASLESAVKFDIGRIDDVPDNFKLVVDGMIAGLLQLPYESCVFEFTVPSRGGRDVNVVAFAKMRRDINEPAIEWRFYFCQDGNWSRLDFSLLTYQKDVAFCEINNGVVGNRLLAADKRNQLWLRYIGKVQTFLMALNCSNTKIVTIKAPEKLNKKRRKKGKTPIFSYKVLEIVVDESKEIYRGGGATHASPRVHLRRGHIRTFKNGHPPVWIQPAIVGNKKRGMVAKDYRVRAQTSDDDGAAND